MLTLGSEVGLTGDKAKTFDEIRNHLWELGQEKAKTETPILWIDALLAALIDLDYIVKKP